jgi:hypothetical protein
MHDETISMKPDATLTKLLEGWLDGGLTDAEEAELLQQLDGDADLRRRFAEQVATLGATRAASDSNPRWLALFDLLEEDFARDSSGRSFEVLTMGRIGEAGASKWRGAAIAWGLAATVALLAAGGFLMMTPDTPGEAAISRPISQPTEAPTLAVVIGGSPEAKFEVGAYLKPGVLAQQDGWITVQTIKGVSVTLDAPFEASLSDHDRIRLIKGRARVHVPPGAEGFRLESPAFEVVDLGTEFAAMVNADGTGTCRVFEGVADVLRLDSMGQSKETLRLTASRSVRINPSRQLMEEIEENDDDYPEIKQSPRPMLVLPPSYAAEVMAMIPAAYWRFEKIETDGVPDEVPGGTRLLAVGSARIVPEAAGNHSGELTDLQKTGFFKIPNGSKTLLERDYTISMFAQFSWLQNFAMISAMRYDREIKGHALILQCYASLSQIGINGSALHAVFRDPPAWDGGAEIVGPARLRPLHWHHIAATRSNGVATIYLDGRMIARETVGSMPLDCREIFVGRLNGNTQQARTESREMVGHIDELAIFPRALSQHEIQRLGLPNRDPK